MKKDFLTLMDFSTDELSQIIGLAENIKKSPQDYASVLRGKSLGMIFAKKSTRTRISFEVGIHQLGGQAIFLGPDDLQLSRGESIEDTAKVLSRYLHGIMIRTYSHQNVLDLAKYASIPVINGLTDYNHPCQALSDLFTIKEKLGNLEGLKLAYLGDGNNVAVSLLFACIKFGLDVSIISPKGYTINKEVISLITNTDHKKKSNVLITDNIAEGIKNAHIVYTDVWASMGQEEEHSKRVKDLAKYSVTDDIMKQADSEAIFMHCLPAHRGEEVSASVIDGKSSIVFDQAENRLHLQKSIMATLIN